MEIEEAMVIEDHASQLKKTEKASCVVCGRQGDTVTGEEQIISEHFMEISVNGHLIMRLSCTPGDLTELVLGRLYTERIIDGTEDVDRIFICGMGDIAEVYLGKDISFEKWHDTEPTCCAGNKQILSRKDGRKLTAFKESTVDKEAVLSLVDSFKNDTELHKLTGGTHSCYLRTPDGAVRGFEDISRHNALDKAVGYLLEKELEPSECMLFTSGRVAADMVEKTIAAGIPVLISKASPTDEALILAKEYGLKLIGKAWPDSYIIFSS